MDGSIMGETYFPRFGALPAEPGMAMDDNGMGPDSPCNAGERPDIPDSDIID